MVCCGEKRTVNCFQTFKRVPVSTKFDVSPYKTLLGVTWNNKQGVGIVLQAIIACLWLVIQEFWRYG